MKNTNHRQNPKTNFIAYLCFAFFCFSFFVPKFFQLMQPIEWYYPFVSVVLGVGFLFAPEKMLNVIFRFLHKTINTFK